MAIRRISTTRWWNKKNFWTLFLFLIFLIVIRTSKTLLFQDIYYFISKPFWPGESQKAIIVKSINKEMNIKIMQLKKDNLRLRKLLSLQKSSDEQKISSTVIARNIDSWWKQLIINKGSRNGVKKGDAVVGPGGLLGIVDNVSYLTSSVKLLTSIDSKVGVWIQKSNISGLLIGVGSESPNLIFYSRNVDIKPGDYVSSSPASTVLPPNIPIGIIESIDIDSKPITTAKVQLIAKPHAIDWVQILKIKF
tara:strand:+ start:433 stop:1179 length:747 start_codon:yes stop_codon:yes gene_type:complete